MIFGGGAFGKGLGNEGRGEEPGNQSLAHTESARASILNFPAFGTVKNKCVLHISHPI